MSEDRDPVEQDVQRILSADSRPEFRTENPSPFGAHRAPLIFCVCGRNTFWRDGPRTLENFKHLMRRRAEFF